MKILRIAVTGSAGSGKSLVCNRFEHFDLAVLDCDVIARQVVEPETPGFNKIVELFGQTVVKKDGTLDRARLRDIIVNDTVLRRKMEGILHPRIIREMGSQIEKAACENYRAAVVEVPLLFELGMENQFDITIAVTAADMALVDRICRRDAVTKKSARKVLDLQLSQEEKIKRADYVIVNKGTQSELFESVDNIFDKIQKEFLTN